MFQISDYSHVFKLEQIISLLKFITLNVIITSKLTKRNQNRKTFRDKRMLTFPPLSYSYPTVRETSWNDS